MRAKHANIIRRGIIDGRNAMEHYVITPLPSDIARGWGRNYRLYMRALSRTCDTHIRKLIEKIGE